MIFVLSCVSRKWLFYRLSGASVILSGKVDLRINIYRGQVDTNNAIINANDTKNGANGVNCGADLDGKKIVVISDIRFKGKRNINWEEVEQYLKEYIGDCYEFLCFFNVLRINDGRKTLKESITLMQSLAGIDLRQGLHFQYITMILEILNGLIYSG